MNMEEVASFMRDLSDSYKLTDPCYYPDLYARTIPLVTEAMQFGDVPEQIAVDLIYLWQDPEVSAPFKEIKAKIVDLLIDVYEADDCEPEEEEYNDDDDD